MNEMTMISDPTDQAIEVKSLTKQFGRFTAVDDLSFTVKTGEAVALWGANGAGKTTVVRCLLNLFPFEGEITINGLDTRQKKQGSAATDWVCSPGTEFPRRHDRGRDADILRAPEKSSRRL